MIVFGFASRRSRPGAAVAVAVVSTLDGSGSLWSNYFGAVKIDIAFVANIHCDPEAARFLRALLALGRDLDLAVVAEGVELPEQAQMLRSLGCELVQGFLYAHPASAAGFDDLLGSPMGSRGPEGCAGHGRPAPHRCGVGSLWWLRGWVAAPPGGRRCPGSLRRGPRRGEMVAVCVLVRVVLRYRMVTGCRIDRVVSASQLVVDARLRRRSCCDCPCRATTFRAVQHARLRCHVQRVA